MLTEGNVEPEVTSEASPEIGVERTVKLEVPTELPPGIDV